jgi:hypothetical protein
MLCGDIIFENSLLKNEEYTRLEGGSLMAKGNDNSGSNNGEKGPGGYPSTTGNPSGGGRTSIRKAHYTKQKQ